MPARTLRIALPVSLSASAVLAAVTLGACDSDAERAVGPSASTSASVHAVPASPAGTGGANPSVATKPGATVTRGAAVGAGSQPNPGGPGGTVPPVATASTGGGSSAGGPLPDPCSLLSAAQVRAALPGAGEGRADPSLSSGTQQACRWTSSSAGHGFVLLVVSHGDARRTAGASQARLGPVEVVDLAGASFGYLAGKGWVAGAQVKTVFVQITLTPTNRAAVLTLAKAAVAAA